MGERVRHKITWRMIFTECKSKFPGWKFIHFEPFDIMQIKVTRLCEDGIKKYIYDGEEHRIYIYRED